MITPAGVARSRRGCPPDSRSSRWRSRAARRRRPTCRLRPAPRRYVIFSRARYPVDALFSDGRDRPMQRAVHAFSMIDIDAFAEWVVAKAQKHGVALDEQNLRHARDALERALSRDGDDIHVAFTLSGVAGPVQIEERMTRTAVEVLFPKVEHHEREPAYAPARAPKPAAPAKKPRHERRRRRRRRRSHGEGPTVGARDRARRYRGASRAHPSRGAREASAGVAVGRRQARDASPLRYAQARRLGRRRTRGDRDAAASRRGNA